MLMSEEVSKIQKRGLPENSLVNRDRRNILSYITASKVVMTREAMSSKNRFKDLTREAPFSSD